LILTRTPLRVSFLGGGSDFPEFFKDETGYVFGSAINLFVFTAVLKHSELADNKYKLTYRINESVDQIDELQHPLVREILKKFHSDNAGLHIATLADVPARTGLGSSSAFAVGLINAISVLHSKTLTPIELATSAINIERNVLEEPGGWQDQCHSAFGGLNLFSFKNEAFNKEMEITDSNFTELLSEKLILVAAGEARDSGTHAIITTNNLPSVEGKALAREMALIAKQTASSLASRLESNEKIKILANAMNRSWMLKQQLGSIHSEEVSQIIQLGLNNGAISAKLCGAGGSGFVLFILGETSKESFSSNFPNNRVQQISLHGSGSEVGPMDWN
jgi:D-glycero-alpha-D-manno-heptose-7-phosphate kinase